MPNETKAGRKIRPQDCYRNAEDYTFYMPAREFKTGVPIDAIEEQLRGWAGVTDRYSYDCVPDWKGGPRLLACRSFQGRYWSVSGRGKQEGMGLTRVFKDDVDAFESGYKARSERKDFGEGFLFPVRSLVTMIGAALGLEEGGKQGLVLVAGATKSAKTLLARGLVYDVLKGITIKAARDYRKASPEGKQEIRRPHLVTFEDPIEKWFWSDTEDCDPSRLRKKPLDYTPRQRGWDAGSLQGALRDALRQTPTVFYIGEIREEEEWSPTIEFAGTGHLVFATAHGGSLTETIVKLCRALDASTPAQRNYIADRLLGVIHVRTESDLLEKALAEVSPGDAKMRARWPKKMLVGSLWRSTAAGVHALTGGGFSSLLSADGNEQSPGAEEYCLGECWWVRAQIKELREKHKGFLRGRGINAKVLEKVLVRGLMHRYLEME